MIGFGGIPPFGLAGDDLVELCADDDDWVPRLRPYIDRSLTSRWDALKFARACWRRFIWFWRIRPLPRDWRWEQRLRYRRMARHNIRLQRASRR